MLDTVTKRLPGHIVRVLLEAIEARHDVNSTNEKGAASTGALAVVANISHPIPETNPTPF